MTHSAHGCGSPGWQDIRDRFGTAAQARRYRDRFRSGRHARTHEREAAALDQLMRLLGRQSVILDMPCGTGRFAEVLSGHCDRLLQADASMHMLQLSREQCETLSCSAHLFQVDAVELPCQSGAVDLVFCHRFLNHVPDVAVRDACLREMARITRRYVVVSCLQLPAGIRVLRRLLRFWKSSRAESSINAQEVIESAERAGLRLAQTGPIRLAFRSAMYLVLAKPS